MSVGPAGISEYLQFFSLQRPISGGKLPGPGWKNQVKTRSSDDEAWVRNVGGKPIWIRRIVAKQKIGHVDIWPRCEWFRGRRIGDRLHQFDEGKNTIVMRGGAIRNNDFEEYNFIPSTI